MARIPEHLPILYADQVMDVIYGVHTSKVVLGVESGNGGVRAVGVAAIPTSALLIVASNIVRDLTSPPIVEETIQRLDAMVNLMRSTAPPASPNTPKGNAGGKR